MAELWQPTPAPEPEELTFDALRRLGIALAQGLAGDSWTDYNVHDPGVTILEQACYALTDLSYRGDFDVADHLTPPEGDIDFERLGLALPERIFPCRPTTLCDYRRAILDEVGALDDVAILPVTTDGSDGALPRGLYRILLRPRPDIPPAERARIRTAVARIYAARRNLGEDALTIDFVDEVECELHALVEVERGRAPEEILAEIYHRCAERIAARIRARPFEQARRAGRSLEEVFTGPLGRHGYYDEADLERGERSHSVADFVALVGSIAGVDRVHDLYFELDGRIERDTIAAGGFGQALCLQIPDDPDRNHVRLTSLGRQLRVPFDRFKRHRDALALPAAGAARVEQDVAKLYHKPRGEHRDLRAYTSIQTQLPSAFAVGPRRLPESATLAERARSRQLKGYLLLFDQLLANQAASVAGLGSLYACDPGGRATYGSQPLDRSEIADLDAIYPPRADAAIAAVVARYDPVADRKGRLFDHLLARYGERFSQNSLRAFDLYTTPGERATGLVENRARFLREIERLTRDRGAAVDLHDRDRANVSGLQLRVSRLLGFTDHRRRALTAVFSDRGLRPVPDDRLGPLAHGAGPGRCAPTDYRVPDPPWDDEVPLVEEVSAADSRAAAASVARLFDEIGDLLPGANGQVAESLLRGGVSLAGYRLGAGAGDASWQAFLTHAGDGPWWRLGAFADREEAIRAVNRLWRLIVLLNTESEGMQVVEHLLLRPVKSGATAGLPTGADADFFSFRVSVLFPAWSARFQDPRFRQLAAETVRLNCPAHVVPEVAWLGFDEMREFERLHEAWLGACTEEDPGPVDRDGAAAALIRFLLAHRGEACWALVPAADDPMSAPVTP